MDTVVDEGSTSEADIAQVGANANSELGAEGNNPVSFLENWLPQVLGTDTFPAPVINEHIHRLPNSGKQVGNTSSRPKTMILKLLNYVDKVRKF